MFENSTEGTSCRDTAGKTFNTINIDFKTENLEVFQFDASAQRTYITDHYQVLIFKNECGVASNDCELISDALTFQI